MILLGSLNLTVIIEFRHSFVLWTAVLELEIQVVCVSYLSLSGTSVPITGPVNVPVDMGSSVIFVPSCINYFSELYSILYWKWKCSSHTCAFYMYPLHFWFLKLYGFEVLHSYCKVWFETDTCDFLRVCVLLLLLLFRCFWLLDAFFLSFFFLFVCFCLVFSFFSITHIYGGGGANDFH